LKAKLDLKVEQVRRFKVMGLNPSRPNQELLIRPFWCLIFSLEADIGRIGGLLGRLTRQWLWTGLAILVVVAFLGQAVAAYLSHVQASATALIKSARVIRTTADAELEIAACRKRSGNEFWVKSRDGPEKMICSGSGCRRIRFPTRRNNVALKMSQREVDGVTVVALDGRIVLGEESNALREKVKELLAEGKKKIVVNVNNITFIDSAGLGTLVASHHTAKKEGASLRLCHLDNKFQQVLQITKLLTVLYISNTEAEAVASLSK